MLGPSDTCYRPFLDAFSRHDFRQLFVNFLTDSGQHFAKYYEGAKLLFQLNSIFLFLLFLSKRATLDGHHIPRPQVSSTVISKCIHCVQIGNFVLHLIYNGFRKTSCLWTKGQFLSAMYTMLFGRGFHYSSEVHRLSNFVILKHSSNIKGWFSGMNSEMRVLCSFHQPHYKTFIKHCKTFIKLIRKTI